MCSCTLACALFVYSGWCTRARVFLLVYLCMRDVFVCGGVVVRVDGWRRASHTVSRVHLQALAGLGDVAHDLRHAALERQLAAVLIQRREELCQHTNRPTSIIVRLFVSTVSTACTRAGAVQPATVNSNVSV